MLSFQQVPASLQALKSLQSAFYLSLAAPLDGMWDSLMAEAETRIIYDGVKAAGYLCIDKDGTLINFYLTPYWVNQRDAIFAQALEQLPIQSALVGTNNPTFLNAVLQTAPLLTPHTLLFEDFNTSPVPQAVPPPQGFTLIQATEQHLEATVAFCLKNSLAKEAWLNTYLGQHVAQAQLFVLVHQDQIIGHVEVRQSSTQQGIVDLGVIVDAAFRGQGLGSFLMKSGKQIAYERGLTPIVSCEVTNKPSNGMIVSAGFVNTYVMVLATLQSNQQEATQAAARPAPNKKWL